MNPFHRLHDLRMENDAVGYRMAEMRPRFTALASRHENGTAPQAVSVYQLFQTPVGLAGRLAALLAPAVGSRILEPSAGLGRLLDAVQPYQPSEVVAVEMAAECTAELYRQDRPKVTIKQRDFLALGQADLGLFDGVIMNPPFHLKSDIQHIEHALKFLKPGGKLAAICMNQWQRRERLGSRCAKWIDLGAGAFREAGTSVDTAMIVMQP